MRVETYTRLGTGTPPSNKTSQTSIWKAFKNTNPFGGYKFEAYYLSLRKAKFEDPYLRNHAINQTSEENSFKNNLY
jgi:hypothetical protein